MSKELVQTNINNILSERDIIGEIVSTQSLKEVSKFKDLQANLSKRLSQQRKELCKSMTTNTAETSQIKKELSDLAHSISATKQRISNAEREYSRARSNLAAANKNLHDAEDAVSRKERDIQKARKNRDAATIWTFIGGGLLTVATAGAAAPLAIGATIAVNRSCSAQVDCERSHRNAALTERDSCVNTLSQAETQLNNAQNEETRQNREKKMLEEKKEKCSEALNTIQHNVKEIDSALRKLNLEVICQERVQLNVQSIEKTMSYEAKMKHVANIESIKVSYEELERRANEMNYVTTCNQIDLKTHLKILNEGLDKFQLAIASSENMKSILNFESFI